MFDFFKKKKDEFVAPVTGELTKLTDVNDDVFSQKMMGDGFAIKPLDAEKEVVAPCDGEVIMVPDTKHAVGLKTKSGVELLVHIGLDTVNLQGKGFDMLVAQGDKVKAGQPLVGIDQKLFKDNGYDTIVMTIFTKNYNKEIKLAKPYGFDVEKGEILISDN